MTEEGRLTSRLIEFVMYALGVVVLAGIVHIVSVLAMPRVASKDAYARVSGLAPVGQMTLLDADTPQKSVLAFEDPATALGVCRYDLRQGPLQVLGDMQPDRLMLFSFHSRFGSVFYSMTDRVSTRGRLNVLVLTPDQLNAYEATDTGDELPKELRITSPSLEGFLLVRSFAVTPDDRPAARAALSALDCSVAKPPQA